MHTFRFSGKLLFEGDVVAEPVRGVIVETKPSQGKLINWSGTLVLPEAHTFSMVQHDACTLVLADGRKGTIIPESLDTKTTVRFQGTGELN